MIVKLLISFLCFNLNLWSDNIDFNKFLIKFLENNPRFDSVRKQKEITHLQLKNSYYSFFPKISLNASSSLSNNFNFDGLRNNNILSLSLYQPILHHSINYPSYQIALAKDSIAKLNIEIELNEICLQAAKLFYSYCSHVEKLNILQEKLSLLSERLEVIRTKYQQGLITQRDLLRFESQIQQAKIQILSLKSSALEKKQELNILLKTKDTNFNLITSANLNTDVPINEPDKNNSALFKKLSIENDIENYNVKQAQRQMWPQIFFNASISNNFDFPKFKFKKGNHNFLLGFEINYDIFSFGKSNRDIQISKIQKDIKYNDYNDKINQEDLKIKQLMSRLQTYQESISLNKKLFALEQANFSRIKNDYLVGKAQYLDLVAALNSLNDVKVALSL